MWQGDSRKDPFRLFAITQRCQEAFLSASLRQFCKREECAGFCDGQVADNTSVELHTALYSERGENSYY